MGKPKFSRKKYETPSHPWKEQRIRDENELVKKYGLKNKREIWKAQTSLRKYRGQARELLAKIDSNDPQIKKESDQLIIHLTRYSVLPLNSTLDDVLALDTEALLARRLQTLTYLKGLANTPSQARQLISHGHIAIGDRRITIPSYKVTKDEENMIIYTADSALNDLAHPARPSGEFTSKITPGPPEPTIPEKPSVKESKDKPIIQEKNEKQPPKKESPAEPSKKQNVGAATEKKEQKQPTPIKEKSDAPSHEKPEKKQEESSEKQEEK